MSGHVETPTETWECRICGVEREVPAQNKGPGVPACGQCGKPMTKRMPPFTTSGRFVAQRPVPLAAYIEPPYATATDPDTVMESQDSDDSYV